METEQQRRLVCPDCTHRHECARCAEVARDVDRMLVVPYPAQARMGALRMLA